MTNNTIPNVPRDWFDRVHALLYKIAYASTPEGLEAECLGSFIPDILSAPSPAGVDGLEVVAQVVTDPDGSNKRLAYTSTKALHDLPVWTKLSVTAHAQAIIDGLRGEVAAFTALHSGEHGLPSDGWPAYHKRKMLTLRDLTIGRYEYKIKKERDQQAQLIVGLEVLLREVIDTLESTDEPIENSVEYVVDCLKTALSAGKEGE